MKKIFIILIFVLVVGCVWAQDTSTIEINGITFEIPSKYQDGKLTDDRYSLENEFSIQCIDGAIPKHIGLWATEKDFVESLTIDNHPVRHYYQYNEFVHDNQSHAYFASNESIYEIKWTGTELTEEIENKIKNTPSSEITEDTFNNILNESIDIYKQEKIDKLNRDGEYNYLEAKYKQDIQNNDKYDTKLNEILLTYRR